MNGGGAFLAGAQSRLLPLSLPFRFFLAAAVYQTAFWGVCAIAAEDLPSYRGGLGLPLAAIHLLTLGVLTMTAVGASLQLLPVATRRAVQSLWPCSLVSWLLIPGVGIFAYGAATAIPWALLGGGAALSAALAVYAALIARNLLGTSGLRLVILHGWAAITALLLLSGLGLLLVMDFRHGVVADRAALASVHLVIASYGFMGMLALGFSFILVPMFALAHAVPERKGYAALGLGLAGIALACTGIVLHTNWLTALAAGVGVLGSGCYLDAMRRLLKSGMRKRLGLPFVLIRASWFLMPLSMLIGAGLALELMPEGGAALFGLTLLAGWLLTFLLGVLQRIAPFLATMHSTVGGGRAARPSDLTADRLLGTHAACHGLALAVVAGGTIAQSTELVRAGALIGLAGALVFLAFLFAVLQRLRAHRRACTDAKHAARPQPSP